LSTVKIDRWAEVVDEPFFGPEREFADGGVVAIGAEKNAHEVVAHDLDLAITALFVQQAQYASAGPAMPEADIRTVAGAVVYTMNYVCQSWMATRMTPRY
jgi:hypothetical protein